MKPNSFRNALLLSMSFGAICARSAWAQNAERAPTGKWNLKGFCAELRLEPSALVAMPRGESRFPAPECTRDVEHAAKTIPGYIRESIPLGSITGIFKEVVTRKPVEEKTQEVLLGLKPENLISTVEKAGEGAGEAAAFAPAAPALLLVGVGAMVPFRGVKTHIESVRILWVKDGTPRSSVFVLSRKNVESLLSALAQATTKNWTEVRFDSEAQGQHASQVLVHFNEPVTAGDITVSGGSYRLLILAAADSTHLVYLFSENKPLPQDAITVLTAEASPLDTGKPWKISLVRNAEASWCLHEIDTDLERLRLHVCQSLK